VRNVTDVDDDILRKARELGVHYLDLAAEEMARFDAEMALLNLLPVWSEPRATSAISEILSLIGVALERGFAYESGGSVYFDVASFGSFGAVSRFDRSRMLELAAEHGGKPEDPNKRNPLDFVLWQPSLPDEPAWESRWGPGRAGTSSARRWCCGSWGRRSTSTAGAVTFCSRTTSARRRSPSR
jgi:L-cysteine:1D-myo-inositol 2-amino-2-deoxy-alpha-D-glucopyranoside ligase